MTVTEYFLTFPAALVAVAGVVGLLVGSFLNVVILRLPVMLERAWRAECAALTGTADAASAADARFDLVTPRSHCPTCGHLITAWRNVPVVSYLFLRGRCAACGTRISPRYPIIEALTGTLSAVVAWRFGFGAPVLGALLLTWALIALTFIDVDHQLLPDAITLPWLWLGLGFNLAGVFADLEAGVLGAMGGFGLLWAVYHLFKLATGKEGMGRGDFKLLAMLGAWLGWQALPAVILLSSVVGAVVGVTLILVRRQARSTPLPFGPYLAAAGWISLLWGSDLTRLYLDWSGLA